MEDESPIEYMSGYVLDDPDEPSPDKLRAQIESYVDKKTQIGLKSPFHLLVLEFEHLTEHVRRTPLQLGYMAAQLARVQRLEHELERTLTRIRAQTWLALRGVLSVPRVENWLDQSGIQKSAITSLDDRKQLVELDPEVEAHEQVLMKLRELRKILEGLIDALKRKSNFISGMQGTDNVTRRIDGGLNGR